jgi:amidase
MNTQNPNLPFKTITEMVRLLRARELSSVELTTLLLERIEALDGRLQSYITVVADQALAAAQEADRELAAGQDRGPLHGAPVAVKDLCCIKDIRTTGGTVALADYYPAETATVVTRLVEAGAVLLGKLSLTEGAMVGYPPELPMPINPWNETLWPGSSSGGSGVATAAGLAYATLGTDTAGSIRYPAAACGVVGLKPTWGRVSRYGVLALAESLDHVGPMARSVADAALVLQTIAGHDPHDPTSLLDPVPEMLAGLEGSLKGVRLGLDEAYVTDEVTPEVSAAVLAAVKLLEELGAEVIEVKLPKLEVYLPAWITLCTAEAVLAHAATYPSQREVYGPWFRAWLDLGAGVTGADYARANNLRAACNGCLRETFASIDLLACPAMPILPFPTTPESRTRPLLEKDLDMSFDRFTAPYNFNGAPSLTLPCGFTASGLPLALQLVGHPLGEPLLCRIGYAYEQATSWHQVRPPLET